jgi:hypothetical protein
MRQKLRWFMLLVCGILVFQLQAQDTPDADVRIERGRIDDTTPFEAFRIDVFEDGSTIVLDLAPTNPDSALDTLLYLTDLNYNILAENDDRVKGDSSSRIEYPQAASGSYRVIATRYGAEKGKGNDDFSLSIQVIAPKEVERPNFDYDVSEETLQSVGYPALAPRDDAIWTILVYYGGDNNLEAAILNDLNEFELAGGSNTSVRVVALVDNLQPEATDAWQTAHLFEVSSDVSQDQKLVYPPTIDSVELKDLGEINTSGGEAFAQFLVWGIRNFPAQRYAVALGSHGAGWHGLITDDTTTEKLGEAVIMSLPQMQGALRLATQEADIEKFDLLINDACLMSSVEYHVAMSEFFRYSIASPEIVVNPAHDMRLFLSALKTDTNVDISQLGERLVNQYIQVDSVARPSSDVVYLTSAVFDLSVYADVKQALDNFATIFLQQPFAYSAILGQARDRAYTYSEYVGGRELVDMGTLMEQVRAISDDPTLSGAADDVLSALRRALLYGTGGAKIAEITSYYQNIFFPSNSTLFAQFASQYFEESTTPNWGSVLRSYYNALTPSVWANTNPNFVPFHTAIPPIATGFAPYPAQSVLDAKNLQYNIRTSLAVPTEIGGRNISQVLSTFELISTDTDGNPTFTRLSEEVVANSGGWQWGFDAPFIFWDVTLPFVNFGEDGNFELLKFSDTVAALQGRYRVSDSDAWNNVSVIFDIANDATGGNFQRVINRSEETGAAADVTIPVGATFQAYKTIVQNGKATLIEGNTYIWDEGGPTWAWQPAPTGDYNASFQVVTQGGASTSFGTQISVNNDGINPDLRSNIRYEAHFSLPRPKEWRLLDFQRAQIPDTERFIGYYRTENIEKTQNFSVYFALFDDPSNQLTDATTLEEAIAQFANTDQDLNYDLLVLTSEPQRITVDGKEALAFDYVYQIGETPTEGRGFVVFHDSNFGKVAYLFGAESSDGTAPNFNLLVQNTLLWDTITPDFNDFVVETDEQGTPIEPSWDYEPDSGKPSFGVMAGTIYPVKISYGDAIIDEDSWVRYYQNQDPTSPTFIATRIQVVPEAPSDVRSALADLLSNEVGIRVEIEDFSQYRGKYFRWQGVIYRGERNGVAVYGRMYLTTLTDADGSYLLEMWFETPVENARQTVTDELEPVVDGFRLQ